MIPRNTVRRIAHEATDIHDGERVGGCDDCVLADRPRRNAIAAGHLPGRPRRVVGGLVLEENAPLLTAAGHRLVTPTYTGVGEREHLADPSNDLELHIRDVLAVLKYEDLRDVILIGHSYGGMVATGVADRARERIAQLVYLDAFVPRDGQALSDFLPDGRRTLEERAKAGDGWRVPPNPTPPDTSAEDLEWISERRVSQSLKTFEQPLKMQNGELTLPRSYIRCARVSPGDPFKQFAERAKREGWRYHEIDASHSPHVTAPRQLAAMLESIARTVNA